MAAEFPASFTARWKELIRSRQNEHLNDFPAYTWTNVDSLVTSSTPTALYIGTGHSIYQQALLPAICSAKHSIHLVTCFWAESPTCKSIREALSELAASRSGQTNLPTLHITIGFSSHGLLQKLFHTSSRSGHIYPPSEWESLGLPDQATLKSGSIEMTVKTLFFTPLSVMHPKYLIVDDATAWIPSCNVSWERWFEGCVELHGGAVQALLTFHGRVWGLGSRGAVTDRDNGQQVPGQLATGRTDTGSDANDMSATQSTKISAAEPVPTILLPSSHHRNPAFRWLRFFGTSKPPMTPLNAALLALFGNAKRKITLVTPNLTAKPVINAILAAISRGVSVEIRTNGGLMVLEQLVTAGTTTNWSVKRLVKKYNKLAQEMHAYVATDVEAQSQEAGKLDIFYYQQLARRADKEDEPVVSHFKMTMVDEEYLVLGSGNMDRASWWTSQELGILFHMPGFEERALWEKALEVRAQRIFP